MDQLELRWLSRFQDKKRRQSERYLEVVINGSPLRSIMAKYEAEHAIQALSDDYVKESDLAATSAMSWLASCVESSYIILLACNCGHWECSHLGVRSIRQDEFVYWRFAINQPYLEAYRDLPEYWFDAADYCDAVRRFFAVAGMAG